MELIHKIVLQVWTLIALKVERERQRDRETERQRDRETERQRDRETERQRDRETERQRDRQKKMWFYYKLCLFRTIIFIR